MARKKVPTAEPGTAMDQQSGRATSPRAKKAKKFEGGELHKYAWHNGKNYGPGDEEAFSKAGVKPEALQMLANKGVLTGFGTESAEEEEEPESEE